MNDRMRPLVRRVAALAALLLVGVAAPALSVPALSVPALSAQEFGLPPQEADRDSLELRVRQRMMQMIQRQLGLTGEQTRKLSATSRKFESQHRELFVRERQARIGLREELDLGDTTRQSQVSGLLDQMLQVQKQRVELMEAEQRELSTFLTPQQRARYFGMQEQIRRRVDEMREQGRRPPGGPRGGIRRPPAGAS